MSLFIYGFYVGDRPVSWPSHVCIKYICIGHKFSQKRFTVVPGATKPVVDTTGCAVIDLRMPVQG